MTKTPERTLFWARRCIFIDREAGELQRMVADLEHGRSHDPELSRKAIREKHADIIDYTTSSRANAQAEGYDDTAAYLQHILDDLGESP